MKPDINTNRHLEDSILLAYIRLQQLDDQLSLRISQHIDVEQCPRCCQKLNELSKASMALSVLEQMQANQHYPEISVADTYARMQSAANKRTTLQTYRYQINHRQRPRLSAMRLVSLPAAFGLAILLTVAMLVSANLSGKSWIPVSGPEAIRHGQVNSTVVVPPHSTPNLSLTATVNADASATAILKPTATPVTVPYIEVCPTPSSIAHWRLIICGHNFEPGYKITLVVFVSGKTTMSFPNIPVDKQGYFQTGWYIGNCENLPTLIVAHQKTNTNTKPNSATLQNLSFDSCP